MRLSNQNLKRIKLNRSSSPKMTFTKQGLDFVHEVYAQIAALKESELPSVDLDSE